MFSSPGNFSFTRSNSPLTVIVPSIVTQTNDPRASRFATNVFSFRNNRTKRSPVLLVNFGTVIDTRPSSSAFHGNSIRLG